MSPGGGGAALFIVSCSKSKARYPEPRPACEVYRGYVFRKVKELYDAALQHYGKALLLVVSAKYGVIECSTPIEYYDEVLDKLDKEGLARWAEAHRPVRRVKELASGIFNIGVVILPSAYLKALLLDDSDVFMNLPVERYLAVVPKSYRAYFPEDRAEFRHFTGRGQLYREVARVASYPPWGRGST